MLTKIILFFKNIDYYTAIPRSLYFNLKYFNFWDAIKLPILISNNVYLRDMGGNIDIDFPITNGMILIGFKGIGIFDENYLRTIWEVKGTVIFKGNACIGHGSKLAVGNNGTLIFGKNFTVVAETTIMCQHYIEFGDGVVLSWDNLIMDTDFHKIIINNQIVNENKPILIGNNVWVGCRCTILKGTIIDDGNVVSSNSRLTRHIPGQGLLIGGSPAKLLKTNIRWEL